MYNNSNKIIPWNKIARNKQKIPTGDWFTGLILAGRVLYITYI